MLKTSNVTSRLIYLPSSMPIPPLSRTPIIGANACGGKTHSEVGDWQRLVQVLPHCLWEKLLAGVFQLPSPCLGKRSYWSGLNGCHIPEACLLSAFSFLPWSKAGLGQLGLPWYFALHRGTGTTSHHALGASWAFGTSQGTAPFCCTAGSA